MTQPALLVYCACGSSDVSRSGFCPRCLRRRRHDRAKFDGNRESRLAADDGRCVGCGSPDASRLVVHHRRPGENDVAFLATLCRACHVRVHHTARPSVNFVLESPLLWRLWRELHRRQPVQLLLPVADVPAMLQAPLFESAGNEA